MFFTVELLELSLITCLGVHGSTFGSMKNSLCSIYKYFLPCSMFCAIDFQKFLWAYLEKKKSEERSEIGMDLSISFEFDCFYFFLGLKMVSQTAPCTSLKRF